MQALRLLGQQLTRFGTNLALIRELYCPLWCGGPGGFGRFGLLVSRPNFALLYAQLDLMEAGKIITELDQMNPISQKARKLALCAWGQGLHSAHATGHERDAKERRCGLRVFDKPAFGMWISFKTPISRGQVNSSGPSRRLTVSIKQGHDCRRRADPN